ncbi:MAG: hypothetical protein ACI8Y3_000995 [Paraglaciecola sp.]|jgi:hypothetical protein
MKSILIAYETAQSQDRIARKIWKQPNTSRFKKSH